MSAKVDAIAMLKADHRTVEDLFEKYEYWGASTSNSYTAPSLYASGRGLGKEGADSSLTYYFQLVGNKGPAQMHVSANGTANVGPEDKTSIPGDPSDNNAFAGINIFSDNGSVVSGQANSTLADPLSRSLLSINGT